VPRMIFVNKMDVVGADFYRSIDTIHNRLKANTAVLQLPIGSEKTFDGLVSLIDMKAYYYSGENGQNVTNGPIPEAYLEKSKQYRNKLIETLAEIDDEMMLLYIEDQEISTELIKKVVRKATIDGLIVPILCGSAYKNKGVQNLLDAIINYLPSPLDRPAISGHVHDVLEERKPSEDEPFSALIFKVMTDPYVGRLSYFRVYSGHIKQNGSALNVSKHKKERLSKILDMHANSRTEIAYAGVGDIVAAVGLKYSTTGDTLSDMNAPIELESIVFPEPVISRAIEPKTPGDFDKMNEALVRLTEEDPTLTSYVHPDTGQILISGMGELHLEIILDRLKREFKVGVNSGKPQVTYRESISLPTNVTYELDKQLGTNAIYALVQLDVKPRERGSGHEITVSVKKKNLLKTYINACVEGIEQSLKSGVIGGYEVIDVGVDIVAIDFKEDQSNDVAFITAGSNAITQALKDGQSKLLEPIFSVDVQVPETYMGDVIDDMNRRHGEITNIESNQSGRLIKAITPLSNLFGYATDLRSITRGHGHYTMIFSHFDFVE